MPLMVRAVVTGFLVFAIAGSLIWTAVLAFIPAPWSILVMAIVLWIYVKYTSGSWWPQSTAEVRRRYFRATKLSNEKWLWSAVMALVTVVVAQSSLVVTFRVIEFPVEAWNLGYDFSGVPAWQVWAFIVMAATVAGITEEVGFRGYMQVPLEGRYGAVVGIGIVSIVFVIAHFTQAWAVGALLVILLSWSVLWGILAYVSGSLVGGIISHAVTDIFNFSYWWTDVAGSFERRPIAETGIDSHFIVWLLILLVSIGLFVWSSRKTLSTR